MLSMIVAVDENLGIGRGNDLMWHLSDDLKRFKAITTGHTVIMGRNTWESLPFKPLKNRRNIIVSSTMSEAKGAEVLSSIAEAIECCKGEVAYVIGGDSIYRQMMPYADELIVTHIYKTFDADTFFPEIYLEEWAIVEEGVMLHDDKSGLNYKYCTYRR